ncbi:MAG: PC4/YdbC family ssDNA-binding protein [Veillonellaceae bacterium]|nr:PC4/YdbC family ssDNA-binding protein [Veillonellaceae bacterium]
MAQINFEIMEVLGVLSTNRDGWKKELTFTSWNGRQPKFDLRGWDSEYQAMTKGLTLTKDELIALKDTLNQIDIEEFYQKQTQQD